MADPMVAAALPAYFPYSVQLHADAASRFGVHADASTGKTPPSLFYRQLSHGMQEAGHSGVQVSAARIGMLAALLDVYRHLLTQALGVDGLDTQLALLDDLMGHEQRLHFSQRFREQFPASPDLAKAAPLMQQRMVTRELLVWILSRSNQALTPFAPLFIPDIPFGEGVPAHSRLLALYGSLPLPQMEGSLEDALLAPLRVAPDSLEGQLAYIRDRWSGWLPMELMDQLVWSFDRLVEEEAARGGGDDFSHVGQPVLRFEGNGWEDPAHMAGYEQHEYEAFTDDADWMPNVIMIAKMTHVWLDQLSKTFGYPITRLDQIPDTVLQELSQRGFTTLWLIGLWERSYASRRIKQLCGNPEAHASAYALEDYRIADELGGEAGFENLKQRAWQYGIRLASDMVPNHTGITSRWVREHPDWFIQAQHCPFPGYRFSGEDLSDDGDFSIQIEDGYWTKHDAAVVFRYHDNRSGQTRYIYHGNDGTSIPWNDTAQLNYLLPEVREAVIQTIIAVARRTPVIRFDAAMILAKKQYQRLWFPQRGLGGGIPSRADFAMGRDQFDKLFPVEFWREVVDRMAVEAPDTLLLAEAFWLMEGYFVRTLGMHRVYNSAFMNMLHHEENAQYRETIANVLSFNPQILQRFVNFMNNPDEKTAAEQFGTQEKYFGVCILLATMPGLPMFGHGQVEGFREKYGMEYRRAYWDETVDQGLLEGHRKWIFPLLKRRWLFSGADRFTLYQPYCDNQHVDENVFAYSNAREAERALVVYNNRHADTAVWINQALPVALEDGTQSIRCLADELGVPHDATDWYVRFHDLIAGVEYLRSGAELQAHGLRIMLGPYQAQVLLNIRGVVSTDEQPWGTLYQQLAGTGVPSLDDALAELQYRPLLTVVDQMLEPAASQWNRVELVRAVRRVISHLPLLVTHVVASQLARRGAACFLKSSTLPISTIARTIRHSGITRHQIPVNTVTLRRMQLLLLMEGPLALLPYGQVATIGLGRRMAAFVDCQSLGDRMAVLWHSDLLQAVAIGCRHCREQIQGSIMHHILRDPRLASFLQVHTDREIRWFNKERFELLLGWMVLRGIVATWQGERVNVPDYTWYTETAHQAGYQLERAIQLASPATEG